MIGTASAAKVQRKYGYKNCIVGAKIGLVSPLLQFYIL